MALTPDHRREYVWQQLESLKSEALVWALLDQARESIVQMKQRIRRGEVDGALRPEGVTTGASAGSGRDATTPQQERQQLERCVFSLTSLGLSPGAPRGSRVAERRRLERVEASATWQGLENALLTFTLGVVSGNWGTAGTPWLRDPVVSDWSVPLFRLAWARAHAGEITGVNPLLSSDVNRAGAGDSAPPSASVEALDSATALGLHTIQRYRLAYLDGRGFRSDDEPPSAPAMTWWSWLRGGERAASSGSASSSSSSGSSSGDKEADASPALPELMPVNAAHQQSRPLGPLMAALAAQGSLSPSADGGRPRHLAPPHVAMPVLTPKDAIMGLALRSSTAEPYSLLLSPARWNMPISYIRLHAYALEKIPDGPAAVMQSPQRCLATMTDEGQEMWHAAATSTMSFTRHWAGLLAWVRANCAGAQSAFSLDRAASGAVQRLGPLLAASHHSPDSSSVDAAAPPSEGSDRQLTAAASGLPPPPSPARVPFPVQVLVTVLGDDRVLEHSHAWPSVEWHHVITASASGVERVSRPGGLASRSLGSPSPGEVHSRLLLQYHQRATHAFWQLALPGCVVKLSPETQADIGASLKQAEAQLRGALAVQRVYSFSAWPPFVRSRAVLQLARPVGVPPQPLLHATSPAAADPLSVLADALAYGPSQLHRPPVARVAKEALRLAERPLPQA